MEDRELTDAERAEVGRVFESHLTFISKTAAQFAPSPDAVSDIVQGVALKLCRGGLSGFRGESKLTTWLFSVTRSVALSDRRTVFRQRRKVDTYAASLPAGEPSYDPHEEQAVTHPRQHQIDTLHRAIDELPTRHRRVLRNQLNESGVIQDRADNLRAFRAREALRSMIRGNNAISVRTIEDGRGDYRREREAGDRDGGSEEYVGASSRDGASGLGRRRFARGR